MSDACEPLKPNELHVLEPSKEPKPCDRTAFSPGVDSSLGLDPLSLMEKARPSVVNVWAIYQEEGNTKPVIYGATGTVVVAPSGKRQVIVSRHLLENPGTLTGIYVANRVEFTQSVQKVVDGYALSMQATEPPRAVDAVVLNAENQEALPPGLEIGNPVHAGDAVLGVGYPRSLDDNGIPVQFISTGRVIATGECRAGGKECAPDETKDVAQEADAPGKSGGAQLNSEGKLVGITATSPNIKIFGHIVYTDWAKTAFVPMKSIVPYLDGGENSDSPPGDK